VQARWLVLLVTVYLSLDVANPLMPGALTFGVEDSVELRQAERFRARDHVALRPTVTPPDRVEPIDHGSTVTWTPAANAPRLVPSRVQRARSSLSVPSPSSEDH
jgi:hypothetical protein